MARTCRYVDTNAPTRRCSDAHRRANPFAQSGSGEPLPRCMESARVGRTIRSWLATTTRFPTSGRPPLPRSVRCLFLVAQAAAQQLWDAFGAPELERRAAAGERAPGEPVTTWQVIVFPDDRQPVVRLEDEVRGVAFVETSRDLADGEEIPDKEITDLADFLLLDGDHDDAGHLTVLQIADGQGIAFDFRYHSAHAAGLSTRAEEFLFVAEAALDQGYLSAFAENAFSAAELLAKAELIATLDTDVGRSKTHKRVLSSYNRHFKLSNTSPESRQGP